MKTTIDCFMAGRFTRSSSDLHAPFSDLEQICYEYLCMVLSASPKIPSRTSIVHYSASLHGTDGHLAVSDELGPVCYYDPHLRGSELGVWELWPFGAVLAVSAPWREAAPTECLPEGKRTSRHNARKQFDREVLLPRR
jgi:hypothetical protein